MGSSRARRPRPPAVFQPRDPEPRFPPPLGKGGDSIASPALVRLSSSRGLCFRAISLRDLRQVTRPLSTA